MKAVTRYHCEHCGKDFRTPNKHSCKKNPELKNCFSCKHWSDWETDVIEHSNWVYIEEIYPICNAEESNPDEIDLQTLKNAGYNLQCGSWEFRNDKRNESEK